MRFWEYDVGDEIRINGTIDGKPTGRVFTYKVVDRYIKRPTLGFVWKSTMLDRCYVLYANDGNLYNKNESDVNELVWKCNGIVIRKYDKHKGSSNMKYNVGDEIRFENEVYRIDDIVDGNYIIHDEIHRLYFSIPCQEIDTQATPIKKDIAESAKKENDSAVDHPSYYQGKIEVIDFIEDKHLGFNLGNCVKYISRHQLKHKDNPLEDLKKARWYLDREISRIEGVEGK